jgi:hypothetical protein
MSTTYTRLDTVRLWLAALWPSGLGLTAQRSHRQEECPPHIMWPCNTAQVHHAVSLAVWQYGESLPRLASPNFGLGSSFNTTHCLITIAPEADSYRTPGAISTSLLHGTVYVSGDLRSVVFCLIVSSIGTSQLPW